MQIVGLTGGVGSGKSTVAKLFFGLGVPVVDTDGISHGLTASGGAAISLIRDEFGDSCFHEDGSLDRAAMRNKVFADRDARKRLEAILHPLIRREVEVQLSTISAPYALLVVPLLVETGAYEHLIDRLLVVDCDEELQIVRTMARNGLSRDQVTRVLAAQASRAERLERADDVILNEGTPDALRHQVFSLHEKYLSLTAAKP